jgi:hypothetical protein
MSQRYRPDPAEDCHAHGVRVWSHQQHVRRLWTLAIGVAIGCDGGTSGTDGTEVDELPDDATCAAIVELRGGVELEVTPTTTIQCVGQPSRGAGLYIGFVPPTVGVFHQVDVMINDVTRGETGAGFATEVLIAKGTTYRTSSCTATIREHRETGPASIGAYFHVIGSVSCTAPAISPDVAATVTVERLEFATVVIWY